VVRTDESCQRRDTFLELKGLMTGYCPPQTIYRIECGPGPHPGLTVRLKAMPLAKYLDIASAVGGGEFAAVIDHIGDMADALVDWNIEDNAGEPVSADLPGLLTQEYGFALFLMGEWIAAVGTVHAAPPGDDIPQPDMPMELLSQEL